MAHRTLADSTLAVSAGRITGIAGLLMLLSGAIVPLNTLAQTNPGDVIVDTEPQKPAPSDSTTATTPRFSCEFTNNQYTVMYQPESQAGQRYPWATPTELGGGWSADRRCSEISRRLESYRPDGLLEMRTAVENGYNTICVTTQNVPSCRIVLTVPPGQDPLTTRDRVFSNLTVADSGQQTQAVNTFAGRSRSGGFLNEVGQALGIKLPGGSAVRSPVTTNSAINLRPFLDRRDGGTGEKLRNSVAAPSNPRLNPDRFR